MRRPTVLRTAAAWALALGVSLTAQSGSQASLPHLERQGTSARLVVDGAPFLVLGGELGNSTGEVEYLREYWPKLQALNLNTVLVPVYWDVIEPTEGRFAFTDLDGIVRDARAHQMRLVLLWFGSWKNSMSCYAPAWVKTNVGRFPRARAVAGSSLDILSPFSTAGRDADSRAFAALMRHVREIDGDRHTVIMVQVENEVGMIPDARDRSSMANELFAKPVPQALLDLLRRNEAQLSPELRALWEAQGRPAAGSWERVFGQGRGAEEIFTAWHLASYVHAVASAGKAEYPLPMFVNAALIRPGYVPGQYPSGGPLPHLADVWRLAAPSIDFLSPDIYFPNFSEWTRRYAWPGNALFVPEAQRGVDASVNALYVIGQHEAIGFAPFGIESVGGQAEAALADSYRLLSGLAPIILSHQGQGAMAGLMPAGSSAILPQELGLGGYTLRVTYERQAAPGIPGAGAPVGGEGTAAAALSPSGGLVVCTGRDEFLFAGNGITVTFGVPGSDDQVGLLTVEEGRLENGRWIHLRWLNGDQTHQGRHLRLEPGRFSVQKIKLYRYREPS